MRPLKIISIGIISFASAVVPAGILSGQPNGFVRIGYQIDRGRKGERPPQTAPLSDPVLDPCYAGVGIPPGPLHSYNLQEADVDIDVSGLDDGFHSINVWLETASGEKSSPRIRWFYYFLEKAQAKYVEYAVDPTPPRPPPGDWAGHWIRVENLDPDPVPCPSAPEWSWSIPKNGLSPGIHSLAVRLLDEKQSVGSLRSTVFQIQDPMAPDPPTLRPDLRGEDTDELCGNGLDDDGDGLVDSDDPECKTAPEGPDLVNSVLPLESGPCADGSYVFSASVDPSAYYPGTLLAGMSFVVLPVPDSNYDPLEQSLLVHLLEKTPEFTSGPDYDRCTRLASLSWTNRPGGYPGGIDVRFDRPNASSCATTDPEEPAPPGKRLPPDETSYSVDINAYGKFEVSVVGWLTEKLAFASTSKELEVPVFCLDELVAKTLPTNPFEIQLTWAPGNCPLTENIKIYRNGVEIAQVPSDAKDYLDADPALQAGSVYCYRIQSVAGLPNPGCTSTNTACVRLNLQRPGDYNQDKILDISDPVCMLGFLFLGDPPILPCEDPGNHELLDGNRDGAFDLSDAIYILFFLFQGGPAHFLGTDCVPIAGCPDVCR